MTYNVFGGTLNPTQIVYGTTTTSIAYMSVRDSLMTPPVASKMCT